MGGTVPALIALEYRDSGTLTGANRPTVTGKGRMFFATVTMKDGLVTKVR